MEFLIPIAAKSLLIAGAALGLLKLMHKRSAADRSWIAHLSLAAVLLIALAPAVLPALNVQGPAFLTQSSAEVAAPASAPAAPAVKPAEAAPTAGNFPAATAPVEAAPVDWCAFAYAAPAALLLLLTLIALARLVMLKARATVLVEPHWLAALAHAQRRMGFKHGTALLTSDDLPSPISWGVMRPVILLNTDAAGSHKEAEAIIAHELAHVANLDWAKLLLSRVTVALFWFNPLVWLLAREAHQLREEAADDAVLAANIEDTDYAKLLVGVARHECRGLLIGAHGVAPARNSLARRVRRVLDGALARAPGGWRWSSAAAFFAAGMAVPVAALNFVPEAPASAAAGQGKAASAARAGEPNSPYYLSAPAVEPLAPPSAASVIANSVASAASAVAAATAATTATAATAASTAAAVTHPHPAKDRDFDIDVDEDHDVDVDVDVDVDEDRISQRVRNVSKTRVVRVRSPVDDAITAKIHGITPDYAAAMRSASRALARVPIGDLVGLKIHGVTPDLVRALDQAGYSNLRMDQIQAAAIHGLRPDYLRRIQASGYRPTFNEAIEMRIHGVTPQFVADVRRSGYGNVSVRDIIQMRIHGVDVDDLKRTGRDP
jgi:beta-lactamase regulating signal transducer with metallopeptidase domain